MMTAKFKRITVPQPVPLPMEPLPALPAHSLPPDAGHHLPKLTKTFLLAGKALFTVDNGSDHYTFKVRRRESYYHGAKQVTFWYSVKSSDPRAMYGFALIGILDPEKGTIKCLSKSVFTPGTKEYDVANWAAQVVIRGKLIPTRYEIQHAGRCGRCGKTLTDPDSIERGIGPECWKHV